MGHDSIRLRDNAIALWIVQIVNYVAPLAVMLHLTNVLGIELYGVVAFSIGIVSLSFVVGDLGFNLSATERISRRRHRAEYVGELVGAVLLLRFLASLIVALLLIAFALLSEAYQEYRALLLLTTLPIVAQALLPTWFFQGIERMRSITVFVVLSRLAFLIGVVVLVTSPDRYLLVPAINATAQAAAVGVAFVLVHRAGYTPRFPSLAYCSHALRMTLGFFGSRLAVAAYMNSGAVILGAYGPNSGIALYAVAEQGYRVLQNAVAPLVTVSYPYLSRTPNTKLLARIMLGTLAASLAVGAMAHFLTPSVVRWLFGPDWAELPGLFDLFLLALPVHVLTVFAGYPLAAALGRLDVANRSVWAGLVVFASIILVVGMLGDLDARIVVLAMIGAECAVLGVRIALLGPVLRARSQLIQPGESKLD